MNALKTALSIALVAGSASAMAAEQAAPAVKVQAVKAQTKLGKADAIKTAEAAKGQTAAAVKTAAAQTAEAKDTAAAKTEAAVDVAAEKTEALKDAAAENAEAVKDAAAEKAQAAEAEVKAEKKGFFSWFKKKAA